MKITLTLVIFSVAFFANDLLASDSNYSSDFVKFSRRSKSTLDIVKELIEERDTLEVRNDCKKKSITVSVDADGVNEIKLVFLRPKEKHTSVLPKEIAARDTFTVYAKKEGLFQFKKRSVKVKNQHRNYVTFRD